MNTIHTVDHGIPDRLRNAEPRHTACRAIARDPADIILFEAWLRPEWCDLLPRLKGSCLEWAAEGFVNGDRADDCRRNYDDHYSERWDEPAGDDDDE